METLRAPTSGRSFIGATEFSHNPSCASQQSGLHGVHPLRRCHPGKRKRTPTISSGRSYLSQAQGLSNEGIKFILEYCRENKELAGRLSFDIENGVCFFLTKEQRDRLEAKSIKTSDAVFSNKVDLANDRGVYLYTKSVASEEEGDMLSEVFGQDFEEFIRLVASGEDDDEACNLLVNLATVASKRQRAM